MTFASIISSISSVTERLDKIADIRFWIRYSRAHGLSPFETQYGLVTFIILRFQKIFYEKALGCPWPNSSRTPCETPSRRRGERESVDVYRLITLPGTGTRPGIDRDHRPRSWRAESDDPDGCRPPGLRSP